MGPAAAERAPLLEMPVQEGEFFELRERAVVGALHIRRASQPRPNLVHEPARRLHDFGIAKALITDAADHVQVNFLLGNTNRDSQKQGTETEDRKAITALHDFSLFLLSNCRARRV